MGYHLEKTWETQPVEENVFFSMIDRLRVTKGP
jgi:hypothetical protein